MALSNQVFNKFYDVSASDSLDLELFRTRGLLTSGIYVGTAGDVAAVSQDGTAVIFDGVPAGTTLNIAVRRINSTGTAASDILALYVV